MPNNTPSHTAVVLKWLGFEKNKAKIKLSISDITARLPYMKMMLCRVMFRKIISIVVSTFVPEHIKFFLFIPFSKPMTSHVPRFGSFLMDVVVHKAMCSRVISFNRSCQLGMIESFELSNWDSKLTIVKNSRSFTFSCR